MRLKTNSLACAQDMLKSTLNYQIIINDHRWKHGRENELKTGKWIIQDIRTDCQLLQRTGREETGKETELITSPEFKKRIHTLSILALFEISIIS